MRHTLLLYSLNDFLVCALSSKKHLSYLGSEQISARRKEVLLDTLIRRGAKVDPVLLHCIETFSYAVVEGTYT